MRTAGQEGGVDNEMKKMRTKDLDDGGERTRLYVVKEQRAVLFGVMIRVQSASQGNMLVTLVRE